jgi:hypothetical protein
MTRGKELLAANASSREVLSWICPHRGCAQAVPRLNPTSMIRYIFDDLLYQLHDSRFSWSLRPRWAR